MIYLSSSAGVTWGNLPKGAAPADTPARIETAIATVRSVGLGMAIDESLEVFHPSTGSALADDDGLRTYSATVDRELLTISEMARESGATPRALRFYEDKGCCRRGGRGCPALQPGRA